MKLIRLSSVVNHQFLLIFMLASQLATYNSLHGQDLNRAKRIVETLASPAFHGRGYVNGGDSLAAEYLATQFNTIGLKKFNEKYFQCFKMSVNTFPRKMKVKLNGKRLVPGRDFVVQPGSRSFKGKLQLEKVDSASFRYKTTKRNRIALKDVSNRPVKILKKLTFSVANSTHFPEFNILKSSIASEPKNLTINIENKFIPSHQGRNVVGYLEGTSQKDSLLVISAHYDHLGKMGKDTYFPGANDNASGVAMLLELARFYAQPENRLPYTIVFIAFAAEEAGLVGSKYFTENPLFPLSKIRFMLNLDLMGSGKEGIAVVNGSVFVKEFSALDSLNKTNNFFPFIKPRGKAANSDHYHFSEKGVPAFFIYTMGEITAYHDVYDKPEVVTFSKFKETFALITAYLKKF